MATEEGCGGTSPPSTSSASSARSSDVQGEAAAAAAAAGAAGAAEAAEGGPMPQRLRAPRGALAAARVGGAAACRVLAYGDSLTAGFHDDGQRFAPYGAALAEALAPDFAAEVWVCGLSGLTAVQMVKRMRAKKLRDGVGRTGKGLQRVVLEDGPFDLALIMAGTNDLAGGVSPAGLVTCIQALHFACHELRIETVALSVPPNEVCPSDRASGSRPTQSRRRADYRDRWLRTNELLADWAAAAAGAGEAGAGPSGGVALWVDTGRLVPFVEGNGLWEEDGLHLSPAGSRRLGEGLAPLVAPLLRAARGAAAAAGPPPAPSAARPMPERVAPPGAGAGGPAGAAARRRLLAYGDSLTAGFHAFGHLFAPYARDLVPALLPEVEAEVWLCGLSGMTAEEMVGGLDAPSLIDCVRRRGAGLRRALAERGPFDAALLMAGTNDLADESDASCIVDNLCQLHRACHAAGVPTVALGVPPSRASQRQPPIARRRAEVNRLLRRWAEGPGAPMARGSQAGVLLYVDTDKLLPYDNDSGHWEVDGLHFSRAGSLRLGARLAPLLRPLLLPGAAAPAPAGGVGEAQWAHGAGPAAGAPGHELP